MEVKEKTGSFLSPFSLLLKSSMYYLRFFLDLHVVCDSASSLTKNHTSLPHLTLLDRVHGASNRALEGLCEVRRVLDWTINTHTVRRMNVKVQKSDG